MLEVLARVLVTFPWVAVCVVACGGANSSPSAPHNDNSERASSRLDGEEQSDPLAPMDEAPPRLTREQCSDGQCFRCGDSICSEGFYCDAALGSCGWLPECASSGLTCSCLTKAMPDCSCTEEQGHLVVSCAEQ